MVFLSPLNDLCTPVENQLTISVRVCIWTLVLFICGSPYAMPQCPDYCPDFVVSFEIGSESSNSVSPFEDCLDSSGSLTLPYEF